MFEQPDIYQRFINGSEAQQQNRRMSRNQKPDELFCQLCSKSKNKSQMYSVSQKCEHYFCLNCLLIRLQESMNRNQDMFCPIDYCPQLLSEGSRFFVKIPNNLHNRYVIWKNSQDYQNRNKSFRVSSRDFNNNYFGNVQVPDNQDNQYKINNGEKQKLHHQIYPEMVQVEIEEQGRVQKKKSKKQRKKKEKQMKEPIKQARRQQKLQQQQKMPMIPAAIPAPIPFREQAIQPRRQIQKQKHGPASVPYNCIRYIAKAFYIVVGLPFMFLLMALLILNMVVIYFFLILSYFCFVASAVALPFCAISIYSVGDDDPWQRQLFIIYTAASAVIGVLSFAIVVFFNKNLKMINHLIIINSWICFIKGLIKIWAYPNAPPVLYLGPRNQQMIV